MNINETNSDPFWFNNLTIIYDKNRLTEFFPSSNLNYIEKLNSLLRLSVYATILIIIYNRNFNMILFPILTALATLYIYKFYKNSETGKILEDLNNISNDKCTDTTKENPFMNVLMSDYTNNPNRSVACKNNNEKIKDNFNENLYRDVSDVWNKSNSQRQFYTMPNTKIPNDQKGFAEWLYKINHKTCKEDTKECIRHEDIRIQNKLVENTD